MLQMERSGECRKWRTYFIYWKYIYIWHLLRTLTRHRRTSRLLCVWWALMGCRVLCRSLHLGCSVDFCELYLHTCMERGHAKGLHVRKQHWDKREQSRCELRSALHVLRFLFRWEALIFLCSSLHCVCVILIPVGSNLDAFWTLFGHLLEAFWALFGCLLDPGTFQEPILIFNDFGNVSATKNSSNLETILILLTTCWRFVFCRFFWCVIFWHFAVSGSILDPIWEAFWSASEHWK